MIRISKSQPVEARAAEVNLSRFEEAYDRDFQLSMDSFLFSLSQILPPVQGHAESLRNSLKQSVAFAQERLKKDILDGKGARATANALSRPEIPSRSIDFSVESYSEANEKFNALTPEEVMAKLGYYLDGDDTLHPYTELLRAVKFSKSHGKYSPGALLTYLFTGLDTARGTAPISFIEPDSAKNEKGESTLPYVDFDKLLNSESLEDLSGIYRHHSYNSSYGTSSSHGFYLDPRPTPQGTPVGVLYGYLNDPTLFVKCSFEGLWVDTKDSAYMPLERLYGAITKHFLKSYTLTPEVHTLEGVVKTLEAAYQKRCQELDERDAVDGLLNEDGTYKEGDKFSSGHWRVWSDNPATREVMEKAFRCSSEYDYARADKGKGFYRTTGLPGQYDIALNFLHPRSSRQYIWGEGNFVELRISHIQNIGNRITEDTWGNIPYHIRVDLLKKDMSLIAGYLQRM